MKTQRYSKQRETVLSVLASTTSHPTANWIYENVKDTLPNISLGTVYRNLSKLAEDGSILKIDIGDGTERYDACCKPHYHLACNSCGSVVDIPIDYSTGLDMFAADNTGCRIDGHTLLFHGLCASCAKKENN